MQQIVFSLKLDGAQIANNSTDLPTIDLSIMNVTLTWFWSRMQAEYVNVSIDIESGTDYILDRAA